MYWGCVCCIKICIETVCGFLVAAITRHRVLCTASLIVDYRAYIPLIVDTAEVKRLLKHVNQHRSASVSTLFSCYPPPHPTVLRSKSVNQNPRPACYWDWLNQVNEKLTNWTTKRVFEELVQSLEIIRQDVMDTLCFWEADMVDHIYEMILGKQV